MFANHQCQLYRSAIHITIIQTLITLFYRKTTRNYMQNGIELQ